ncbi:hypothetical protein JCM10207_007261 [Rhodosporidiobolus poonsookiae]
MLTQPARSANRHPNGDPRKHAAFLSFLGNVNTVLSVTIVPELLTPWAWEHYAVWVHYFRQAIFGLWPADGATVFPDGLRARVVAELRHVAAELHKAALPPTDPRRGSLLYLPLPDDPKFFPTLRIALSMRIRSLGQPDYECFPWLVDGHGLKFLIQRIHTLAALGRTPGPTLQPWMQARETWLKANWVGLSLPAKARVSKSLEEMGAYIDSRGAAAFTAGNDLVSLAEVKALEASDDTERSLSKRNLRVLGHRQAFIYGQSRAMGDFGAEERRERTGRAF